MSTQAMMLASYGSEVVGLDEHFANVVLLVKFDESEGSTSFTDSSTYNHTATANAGAEISTTSPIRGLGSGLFDDVANPVPHVTYANHASAFELDGQFTIEFKLKTSTTSQCDPLGANFAFATSGFWSVFINDPAGRLALIYNGSIVLDVISSSVNDGDPHHIAYTRDASNNLRVYIDGVHISSTSTSSVFGKPNSGIILGAIFSDLSRGPLAGCLDDVRITKGVARWTGTGSFTPPAAEEDYLPA